MTNLKIGETEGRQNMMLTSMSGVPTSEALAIACLIYYLYDNDVESLITDNETQQPKTEEKVVIDMTHDSSLSQRNQNLLILKNRLLVVSSGAS